MIGTRSFVPAAFALVLVGCTSPSEPEREATDHAAIIGGAAETKARIVTSTAAVTIGNSQLFCSGSYVGGGHVILAAHCLFDDNGHSLSATRVRFYGSADLQSVVTGCRVSSQAVNPSYSQASVADSTWSDDIAVVTIDTTSCDLHAVTSFNMPPAGEHTMSLATGFGSQTYGVDQAHAFSLKTLAIDGLRPIFSQADYTTLGTEASMDRDLTPSQLTAWIAKMTRIAQSGQKRCLHTDAAFDSPYYGDSGGPAYFFGSDGNPVLTGIFSSFFFNDDDMKNRAFCYTSIDAYRPWLDSVMR
jgi:secreted trypsin-like serine protease